MDETKNQNNGGVTTPPADTTSAPAVPTTPVTASDTGSPKVESGSTATPSGSKTQPEPTVAELIQLVKQQAEDIEMLKGAADKGRVEHFLNKRKKAPTPVVRVSYLEGKPIVAWRNILDEVYRDSDGVWHEKQIMEVTFEDGSTSKLSYIDFQRLIERKNADVVKRNTENDEDAENGVTFQTESFTVKVQETGAVLTLDGAFIN